MVTHLNYINRLSKKLPIVLQWGNKPIHIGEIEFLKNGSLVFDSKFHSDRCYGEKIEFGTARFRKNQFSNGSPENVKDIGKGFHISLHPASGNKPSAMHFRGHYPGEILYRYEFDWFPVVEPFNLIHMFTMPLDMCPESQKKATIESCISSDYKDSLELIVDIFPTKNGQHYPYLDCIEVWGTCPDYRVRISIIRAKQRTAALIYWPEREKKG